MRAASDSLGLTQTSPYSPGVSATMPRTNWLSGWNTMPVSTPCSRIVADQPVTVYGHVEVREIAHVHMAVEQHPCSMAGVMLTVNTDLPARPAVSTRHAGGR